MKTNLYIITLLLLSVFLGGCTNEANTAVKDKDNTHEESNQQKEKQKESAVVTKGKEKIDTLTLKEESLYQVEAQDGDYEYTMFLYSGDEQSSVPKQDDEGGPMYKGYYSFYLAEKDSTVAYKQDVFDEAKSFTFDTASDQVYPLHVGKKTIIAIIQHQKDNLCIPYFMAVDNGEIKMVQKEKALNSIYGTEIKTINQKFLQTVHFDQEKGWSFNTWLYDDKKMTILLQDQSQINLENKQERFNKGEYWYRLWSKKKEHYYPFLNLKLNEDVLEKAEQGIPIGSPYPIGTNISEIKKSDPNFMEKGVYNGTDYLMYPEITYYYDNKTGIVTAVSIPGERMKTTLDEIKKLFGKPEHEGPDELRGGQFAVYRADKYVIQISAANDGKVETVYLRKN